MVYYFDPLPLKLKFDDARETIGLLSHGKIVILYQC